MSTGRRAAASRGAARAAGAEAEADGLAAAAEALAVLLDAGIAPESAWRYVGPSVPDPRITRAAVRIDDGAAIEEALAAEAGAAGRAGAALRSLAAAWAVASAAGSPLGPALRGTAVALRERAEIVREVDVALSGPRSTARLVGWLPAVGLGFAFLLGVDVLGALTGSPAGAVLLGAGAALAVAGRLWTRALVRRAAPDGAVAGIGEELVVIALGSGLSVDGAMRLVTGVCERLGADPPDGRAIDEVLDLAERAGAPAAELLSSAAEQRRRVARADGRRGAAALGVRLLLPLAVCVLPSFLLLGVAPVVLGLISSTVTGIG